MQIILDTEKILYLRHWRQPKTWVPGYDLQFTWEEDINLASTLNEVQELKENPELYKLIVADPNRFQSLEVSVQRIVTIVD